jgi:hypothetical protein
MILWVPHVSRVVAGTLYALIVLNYSSVIPARLSALYYSVEPKEEANISEED